MNEDVASEQRLSSAETPTPDTLPADLVAPLGLPAIPGFVIERELGRGGMGVVYLARQVGLDRLVALKVVLFAEHASPELRRRFVNEARTVARLSHANIVGIHDIAEHNGLPYFSLEYCAGGTLADRLRGGPMPPREAAGLVRCLALAVQAAHDQGIIHRDLKPGNILFAADGTPRVADFGLARRADSGQQTQSGAIVGTPSYMAPEQARGKSREVGPQTDVWALGAILYECLTGRAPFRADSTMDILMQVIERPPEPPRRVVKGVPADLEAVCLECLDKLPGRRPAGALALANDFGAFLEGRSRSRRSRWLTRAWGLLAACLVAGVAAAAWLSFGAKPEPAREAKAQPTPVEEIPQDDEVLMRVVDRFPPEVRLKMALSPEERRERVKPATRPTLYGIVVGVNDYSNASGREGDNKLGNLTAAVADAEAVHKAFLAQKGRYYQDVQLVLLRDREVTKEAILDRLAGLRPKVTSTDRVMLFLSGSGKPVRAKSGITGYQFFCSDSRDDRPATMLFSADVAAALGKLPCYCVVMIDACHSGAAALDDGFDPGRHVLLAACKEEQFAFETNPEQNKRSNLTGLRNGLFTSLLLDAMRSATADLNDDGVLDTNELFRYIRRGLPALLDLVGAQEDSQVPALFPPDKAEVPIGMALRGKK